MTIATPTLTPTHPRRLLRGTAAVFVGFMLPVALVLTGFPCVYAGGVLHRQRG